ncbi:hypothetical protein HUK80_10610 [Flavobacterium sp. MAH-1]|uniref:Uncharacterized protein n=1 Tax=Flavobacterium agri TaxID=2743471 RepID=A0A7Y9C7E6_9FLAO|nr:hypothetical protein [Flavobacterium agri]NUY81349.1 hypothetical protein [Flavobacterium agri]NYA71373.1 hypothetical protein [Flavobacterium agri]
MKKAILTFGLFSLVLVLTSFTTPESVTYTGEPDDTTVGRGDTGGVKLPGDGKKLDFETGGVKLPGDGKKLDFETGGVKLPGDGKKLD